MTDNCIFCSIVSGVTPSDIIKDTDNAIYFRDINPKARVHILAIPKKHIGSLAAIAPEDQEVLGAILRGLSEVATRLGIDASGYRVVTNCGPDAGQDVKHLHFHLLGGEALGPLRC